MKWITLLGILLLVMPFVLGADVNTQQVTTYHCTDPDGVNINTEQFIQSTLTITSGTNIQDQIEEQHTDLCMTSQTLKEFYCELDVGFNTNLENYRQYVCEYGCSGGACIEPPIIDQDTEPQAQDLSLDSASECGDGYDNDNDGFIDLADAGCASITDDYEDNACGDYWDNDNDNYKDYYGGCDIDGDGWTDYYCGCDLNSNNYLEVNGLYGINEFNVKYENCQAPATFGCINLNSVQTQGYIDTTNICQDGTMYLPDPQCSSFGDDNERDSGIQIGGSFLTNVKSFDSLLKIQKAFLMIPPGLGFFIFLI